VPNIISPYTGTAIAIPEELPVRVEDMAILAKLEGVLSRTRLSLYCPRCHANGAPDGVVGQNALTDHELSVRCGCTNRVTRRRTG
jgi:hypothetical protein